MLFDTVDEVQLGPNQWQGKQRFEKKDCHHMVNDNLDKIYTKDTMHTAILPVQQHATQMGTHNPGCHH